MYQLLPELAGNTRVYLDDDTIANVIAGIQYPNPTGTKMHAVGEAYRSRTINRIAGNVAANTDRNRFVLQTEFAVSEKITLTTGVTDILVSGRYYVQDFLNGAADVPVYATPVDVNGTPIPVTVVDIEAYDDFVGGWVSVPLNSTPIVIVDTNPVTSMTVNSVVATTVLSLFSRAAAGDHCVLVGGVNAGTYLVDRIAGNELFLTNVDGEPLQQLSGQAGFDTSDPPTDCQVISNGHFITNPTVYFSASIPAGINFLLLSRSARIGDTVISLPGTESTFPDSAGGGALSDTLQTAYNAGNTIALAASTNLSIAVPPANPGGFEITGASGYFNVGANDSSGNVTHIAASATTSVFMSSGLVGATIISAGSAGMALGAVEGGFISVTTHAGVATDSGYIVVQTGGEGLVQTGFDSGALTLGTGSFASGIHNSGPVNILSGNALSPTGDSGELSVKTGDVNTGQSGSLFLSTGAAFIEGPTGDADLFSGDAENGDSGAVNIATGNVSGGLDPHNSGSILLRTGNASVVSADRRSGNVRILTGSGRSGTGYFEVLTGSITSPTPGGPSGPILFETGEAHGVPNASGGFHVAIGRSFDDRAGDITFRLGQGAPNSHFFIQDPLGGTIASWTTASPNTMYLDASLEFERGVQNYNRLILPYTDDFRGVAGCLRFDGTTLELYTGTAWDPVVLGSGVSVTRQDAYEAGGTVSATSAFGSVVTDIEDVGFIVKTPKDHKIEFIDIGGGNGAFALNSASADMLSEGAFDIKAGGDITIQSFGGSVIMSGLVGMTDGGADFSTDPNNVLVLPSTSATTPPPGSLGYDGTDVQVYDGAGWVTIGGSGGGAEGDMQAVYDNGATVLMTEADDVVYTMPVTPGPVAFRIEGTEKGRFIVQGDTLGGMHYIEMMANRFNLEAYEAEGFRVASSDRTTGVIPSGEFRVSTGDITGTSTAGSGLLVLESGTVAGPGNSGIVRIETGATELGTPGGINIKTGDVGAGGTTGGDITLETGAAIDAPSGDLVFTVGNSTNNDSGDIEFNLGTPGFGQTVGSFFVNDPSSIPIMEVGMGSPYRRVHMRGSIEFDRVIATPDSDYRLVLPYTENDRGVEGALRYSTQLEFHDGAIWQPVGGGGVATLQSAYDLGNTIGMTAGQDIEITAGLAGVGTVFDCAGTDYLQIVSTTGNELGLLAELENAVISVQATGMLLRSLSATTTDPSGGIGIWTGSTVDGVSGVMDVHAGNTVNGTAGSIGIYSGVASGSGIDGFLQLGVYSKQDMLSFAPAGVTLDATMTVTDTGGSVVFTRNVAGDGIFVLPETSTTPAPTGALRYTGVAVEVYTGASWVSVGAAGTTDLQNAYDTGRVINISAATGILTINLDPASATNPLEINGITTHFSLTSAVNGEIDLLEVLTLGGIVEQTTARNDGTTSGNITIRTGPGIGGGSSSGTLSFETAASLDGDTGEVILTSGNASGTAKISGDVIVRSGTATLGTPGDVKIETSGLVQIIDGSALSVDTGYRRGTWEIYRYDYAYETITQYDAVCLVYDVVDDRLEVAVASAVAHSGEFLGIALAAAVAGDPVYIIVAGKDVPIRTNESWLTSDYGNPCYLSQVNLGRLIKGVPVTPGQWITRVGLITDVNKVTLKSFEPKEIL